MLGLKASAAFDHDKKQLRIVGEIVQGTPFEHELLVAVLDKDGAPDLDLEWNVDPVSEKVTFVASFTHTEKDVAKTAHTRLQDRKAADDAGVPLHVHVGQRPVKNSKKSGK